MKDRILDCRKGMVMGVAGTLAILSLAAAPALAQDNATVAAPAPVIPPAPKPGAIGPGELSNFSLPGTVTRSADKPAATPTPAPSPSATATKPTATRPAATTVAPANARPVATANDLFRRPPTLPNSSDVASTGVASPVIASPIPMPQREGSSGMTLWPWAIALLAIVGAGLLWFGRHRRQGQRYAAAGSAIDIVLPPEPSPRPDPTPAVPVPVPTGSRRPLPTTLMPKPAPVPAQAIAPRPDPIIPGGIVSTGLRPWIDVELSPDRALLDEQGAAIAFEVTLFNSGSAAARDVVIEAKLLNAGASQDVELSAFFTAEATLSDPIPQIAPYARVPLRSAVRLPRSAISEYDYEGRKLFMPLVAISVRYRWSTGDGQSAAGFLVGQGTEGQEKLAPLRIDRGARSWKGLGARRYEKGVRR